MKEMTSISACRSCGSRALRPFLDMGKQPLANAFLSSAAAEEKIYRLSLSFCAGCSLVQLNETIDPKILFLKYPWVTGTSNAAREFSAVFAHEVLRRCGKEKANPFILEVASNDGTFLLPFLKKGLRVLGVDPARNVAAVAKKNGVPTRAVFFGTNVARRIARTHGLADVIIARNVLYHIANLGDGMKGDADVLDPAGLFAAEFHYGGRMLKELHYDTVYHEHVCYYTLKSFAGLLARYGLHCFDIGWSPINGGGLIVYASKNARQKTARYARLELWEKRGKINQLASWRMFAERVAAHKKDFFSRIDVLARRDKRIVGYGASARSSTLLNYCGIGKKMIAAVADANPFKQGLFTAGTRIPILRPDEVFKVLPDAVVLLAWNFRDEIKRIIEKKYGFKGTLIMPLPRKSHVL